jgi:ABC-type transport system substrate-binding protein
MYNSKIFSKIVFISILFLNFNLITIVQTTANLEKPAFFSVHLLAPTSNPTRMQAAQLIEGELQRIGIDAELSLVSWSGLGPRTYYTEVGPYNEGGYDLAILGMTPYPYKQLIYPPNVHRYFAAKNIPPYGLNIMYWSPEENKHYNTYRAQESEDLLSNFNSNANLTIIKQEFNTWQKLWYDVMPVCVIYNHLKVKGLSSALFGYDPVFPYPLSSKEDHFLALNDPVRIGVAVEGDSFLSIIADDIFDQYSAAAIHDCLIGRAPSKDVVLPPTIDPSEWFANHYPDLDYMDFYPRVAKNLGSFSEDMMNFTIELREDVYFHDGHRVDANDVAFTFRAHLTPDIGSASYSTSTSVFGIDTDGLGHGNSSFLVEDRDTDGFDETITFYFNASKLITTFFKDFLTFDIYPEHILGDPIHHGTAEAWQVAPDDWWDHPMNTGEEPPIGCGSLVWYSRDDATGAITLKKFNHIKWTGSNWDESASLQHWRMVDGQLDQMPSTYILIEKSVESAIEEMKNGGLHILDPMYNLDNRFNELQAEKAIQAVVTPYSGWQGLFINPKFNQDGIFHFQKKGVRHAISHILPRAKIVSVLGNELTTPAYTVVNPSSWEAISSGELINYKRFLKATDGTAPEANTKTAYDEYSVERALSWLETEGYDTSFLLLTDHPPQFISGYSFMIVIFTILGLGCRKRLG